MSSVNDIMNGLSPEERQAVLTILNEQKDNGASQSLRDLIYTDYEEIPVSAEEFITNPHYAGNYMQTIYPFWKDQLRMLFDEGKHYSEVALTGSIGTGKSSMAILGMAYEFYKLMCLKNPQRYWGTNKTIFFAFFNNNLDLARSVGFAAFQDLLRKSEWFNERGEWRGKVHQQYYPFKDIELMAGSLPSHIIGKDVYCALQDEINFSAGANIHLEQNKIMLTYNNIYERIASRFTRDGQVMGTLFLVSSKKSEYDFLESYIRKQKGKPHVFVADAKIWDVKPAGVYSGKKFNLAVGGSNLPSKIIPDDEDPATYERVGYEVIEVPVEHKQSFELDMQSAIMNVAGISITHVLKFFSIEQIQKCYTDDVNPFVEEVIPIGLKDNALIQDFFLPQFVPEEIYSRPIFIHLDMAVNGDRAGIGAVAAMGYSNTSEYDISAGKVVSTRKMVYRHVFNLGIEAPKNDQIHFAKVREFLYHLKFNLGWNIKGVSTDGFNSVDMRQQLVTMGFQNVSLVSLDRTPDGYMALKSAIAEKRIAMLKLPLLERELVQLERDNVTGKLDHPLTGSKDCSDGLAGALYNALLHENDIQKDLSDLVDIMISANDTHTSSNHTVEKPVAISNEIDMNAQEILAEAKRRASLSYQRSNPQNLEFFNPTEGIIDI